MNLSQWWGPVGDRTQGLVVWFSFFWDRYCHSVITLSWCLPILKIIALSIYVMLSGAHTGLLCPYPPSESYLFLVTALGLWALR